MSWRADGLVYGGAAAFVAASLFLGSGSHLFDPEIDLGSPKPVASYTARMMPQRARLVRLARDIPVQKPAAQNASQVLGDPLILWPVGAALGMIGVAAGLGLTGLWLVAACLRRTCFEAA